jgi:hypothetical protein
VRSLFLAGRWFLSDVSSHRRERGREEDRERQRETERERERERERMRTSLFLKGYQPI